jgi:hypothetical protein
LIARVRALPANSGGTIPAIALTAYAAVTDAERMILSGFQIHLAKPLQATEFLTALEGLVTANPLVAGSGSNGRKLVCVALQYRISDTEKNPNPSTSSSESPESSCLDCATSLKDPE